MSERKTQIWLRPDQVDLLRAVLGANHAALERGGLGNLESALLRFCRRQIGELIALLPEKPETLAPEQPAVARALQK